MSLFSLRTGTCRFLILTALCIIPFNSYADNAEPQTLSARAKILCLSESLDAIMHSATGNDSDSYFSDTLKESLANCQVDTAQPVIELLQKQLDLADRADYYADGGSLPDSIYSEAPITVALVEDSCTEGCSAEEIAALEAAIKQLQQDIEAEKTKRARDNTLLDTAKKKLAGQIKDRDFLKDDVTKRFQKAVQTGRAADYNAWKLALAKYLKKLSDVRKTKSEILELELKILDSLQKTTELNLELKAAQDKLNACNGNS